MYGKPNRQLYNLSEAEILRSLSDSDIARFANRGAPLAILEQAYRHNLHDAWQDHNTERSDFERTCMAESEMRGVCK